MTSQTALAVISDFLGGSRFFVGIVTRYAAELIRAARFFKTSAGIHLLDRADKLVLLRLLGRPDKVSNEQGQGKSWSKVKIIAATAQNPLLALKMTLLADRFAKRVFQVSRVNNGVIHTGD